MYRLLFSYYSLFGILTVQESSKVAIRATDRGDKRALQELVVTRLTITGSLLVMVLSIYLASTTIRDAGPDWQLVAILSLAALFFSLDLYQPLLQAQERFPLLFAGEFLKFGVSLTAFISALRLDSTLETAVLFQLLILAAFNILYFAWHVFSFVGYGRWPRLSSAFHGPAAHDAVRLSVGAALPASLEFVDKILLGRFLTLAALGNYALGFSTGRLVYNALKPALYIYYRQFVEKMPPPRVVRDVFIAFTLLGALGAVVFTLAVDRLTWMSHYRGAVGVTDAILLSYGAQMADSVYTQAFSINRLSNANHILVANLITSLLCLTSFVLCLLLPERIATVAIAASFVLNTLRGPIIVLLRRRAMARLMSRQRA